MFKLFSSLLAVSILAAAPAAAQLGGSGSSGGTGATAPGGATSTPNPSAAPLSPTPTPGAPTTLPTVSAPGSTPLLQPDASNSPLTPGLSPQQTLTPRQEPAGAGAAPDLRQRNGTPAVQGRAAATRCEQVLRAPSAHTQAEVEKCRTVNNFDARFNQLEDSNRRAVRSVCPTCLD